MDSYTFAELHVPSVSHSYRIRAGDSSDSDIENAAPPDDVMPRHHRRPHLDVADDWVYENPILAAATQAALRQEGRDDEPPISTGGEHHSTRQPLEETSVFYATLPRRQLLDSTTQSSSSTLTRHRRRSTVGVRKLRLPRWRMHKSLCHRPKWRAPATRQLVPVRCLGHGC